MDKSFIFAHDRQLVIDDNGKLDILPNPKYVLLGDAQRDGLDDVLVARELKGNVEKYSNACAYSGWIALVNSGLIDSEDFVYLFEYDTTINPSALVIRDEVVGFFALASTDYMFLNWNKQLDMGLRQVIDGIWNDTDTVFRIAYAPMTSNIAMKGKWLKIIAMELESAIKFLGNHPCLGHILERLVVFTIWKYNIPYRLYLGAVEHDMACSHGQLKGYR